MTLDRRGFLAALAAPLVVKSNVGLTVKPAEFAFQWIYFKPGELEAAYQKAMFGGVVPDATVFMSKDLFNHQDKFYRDYYAPRP